MLFRSIERFVNKSIRDAEVLLSVFLRLVIYMQVKVLKVTIALCVGLAGNVKDVSNSTLDQFASLKSRLVRPHEDAGMHLE